MGISYFCDTMVGIEQINSQFFHPDIADIGEEDEFGHLHLQPQHLGPPTTLTIYGRK